MAVNLTVGAIEKMSMGEVTSEKDMTPVVQVMELKLVQSKVNNNSNTHQQQQQEGKERFRLVLSDGTNSQQGMLGTTKNEMVKSGTLQVGSIVQLTQFVCSVIQTRRIVIIVDLEVIIQKSDIIGNPIPMARAGEPSQSSVDQRGRVMGNPQSLGGSSLPSGTMDRPNVALSSQQQTRGGQLHGGSNLNSSDSPRYGANNVSHNLKSEFGAGSGGFSGPVQSNGPYNNQNMGFGNARPEVSRPRPLQPVFQPPPSPMYGNRGPVAKNEAPPRIIPIAALNPYQGRWTIKARVTAKGELRHYNNPRGDGKVFSFDLLDADGGEIRVTCFNAVADQFYNQIEIGKVYLTSRGSLRPAQKNFNHLPNDYEIILDSASTIQQCYEDDVSIPRHQFHFCLISDVENMESNSIVDVIGVVSFISPTTSIMRKNGTETQKRTLQLKDTSGRSVELTLWGNFCNAEGQKLQNLCDSGASPVLAVKAGRISDFNGKALGTIASSQLFIEPDFPESRKLKEWFEREGRNVSSISISREISGVGRPETWKTISQIKDEKLGTSEKPDWISVRATIIFIKSDNFCYTACPIMNGGRPCNKKVTNNGDGTWRCDKCDKCMNECDYRYILQLQIQDHTGITWVTAFQETGEEIMGITAKDLYYLKYEHQDDEKFAEIIRKAAFTKYVFKLKIKEETFSDEQRVKATVVRSDKVNYSSDSRFLLDAMEKLKSGDDGSLAPKPEISNFSSDLNNIGIRNTEGRHTHSAVGTGGYGLPAHQVGQYGNRYAGSGPPTNGNSGMIMSCNSCGSSGHVSANCPSIMSEPGHYVGAGYSSAASPGKGTGGSSIQPGRYGGLPRQQVGGY